MQITQAYKYGCLRPIENEAGVRQQMRAAHRYHNDLIALERCKRGVYRDLRARYCDMAPAEDTVAQLVEELAQLRTAIKAERQSERRRVVTASLNQAAVETREKLRVARNALKEAREAAKSDADFQQAVALLEERAAVWARGLRAQTQAFWGSYLLVEASMQQAKRSKVDPSFRRASGLERVGPVEGWPGEGRISVQLQGGATLEELFSGEDTRVRIEPVHPDAWTSSSRSVRRKASRTRLWLRVGSDEKRKPIWAVFPLEMHRPLPDNARITWVTVHQRVPTSRTEQWHATISFTVDVEPLPRRPGVVALDLGWRKRPDASLRVAYWADDQGRHGEMRLPAAIPAKLRHARGLQEVQSRHFNRAHRWLSRWLKVVDSSLLPGFLREAAAHFDKWKSAGRLRRLVLEVWRVQRFAGDHTIYGALERWAHRSRHHNQWERAEIARALHRRKNEYRILAAGLARSYGVVVLEDFDLTRVQRRVAPESADADAPAAQKRQLNASAPGELRGAIINAVKREGGLVPELNATGTTSTCHACGASCEWDQEGELWHRCEHCGAEWDQDHNAALNLLSRWRSEQSDPTQTPPPAREAPKRAARRGKSGSAEQALSDQVG
jgi:Putative transposase DNA-binding domain